jgi:hypothetical protein
MIIFSQRTPLPNDFARPAFGGSMLRLYALEHMINT